MKSFPILKLLVLSVFTLVFSSCLTVEKKEYSFEITGENSGKMTIRYINIISVMDEGNDVSKEDFADLLERYISGTQIEQDFPGSTNIKTRLYEENGTLCGEVTLDFPSLSAARLYQYDKNSPLMMCISAAYDSETYLSSNGSFGNDFMPVVFWPSAAKKLVVATSVSAPDETSVSLLEEYRKWIASK
ncbi:MAG: hypothetical protein RBS07_11490 [Lentimicrobium sp.]|jgi:hypothetical protein|nr:hypothetical protein [Lentimicrobium sp.]